MCTVVCGGVKLDCSDLVRFLKGRNGRCTRQELLGSEELASVAKQYSDITKNSCDISSKVYAWFADVVVGELVKSGNVQVGYDFTEIG